MIVTVAVYPSDQMPSLLSPRSSMGGSDVVYGFVHRCAQPCGHLSARRRSVWVDGGNGAISAPTARLHFTERGDNTSETLTPAVGVPREAGSRALRGIPKIPVSCEADVMALRRCILFPPGRGAQWVSREATRARLRSAPGSDSAVWVLVGGGPRLSGASGFQQQAPRARFPWNL